MMMNNNYAVFIVTNGRPDKVKTYSTIKRLGYKGNIYLIVDDLDKTKEKYIEKYGNEVIVFDKKQYAKLTDSGNNFNTYRGVVYARNACFDIAKELNLDYFIVLDDDYCKFDWRFNNNYDYCAHITRELDKIFDAVIKFISSTDIASISLAQGGDFIGGSGNQNAEVITLTRKCMNSFFCCTNRPFKFLGQINEDTTSYCQLGSTGLLFFTANQVSLTQVQTQASSGGMTELYLDNGTYVKSFYSVMYSPSSVKVKVLNSTYKRLHHSVSWVNTVPKILREQIKKK